MKPAASATQGNTFPACAFTLVELLVTIGIMGILAGLLFPALSRAKNHAVQTVDIGNLKQFTVATQLYATDNHEFLPWPNWGNNPGRVGWLYGINPSAPGTARFDIKQGFFWSILGNQKLYFCPMDNTNSPLFAERAQQLSSYAMNGAVVGYDRTNFPAARSSEMRADDIAFWETDERQPQYFNDGANYPQEGVSARHLNGAINASFGGAVTYVRLGAWYVQVYDVNKNSLWCYPGSADGR
ncbi:MAG TPA: type II secretion system protein [Candidatus Angelobacter sp.]|nr:type II secretion system protein [Candidatus Angelobacter sp.]